MPCEKSWLTCSSKDFYNSLMQDAHISLTCANQPTFKLRDINALQNSSKPINSKKNWGSIFSTKHKIVDGQKHIKTQNHRSKKALRKFQKHRYEKKSTKSTKIQKVSGKRSQPTTSLFQSSGLKGWLTSTMSIIPSRPQTGETNSKRRHRTVDAPRATYKDL